ncbi:MAG: cyclase family protein [Anaerolineaceae bacterium]|jgi:arylformamidase|nr:cyclase family protein [Anaerolineaceae bacterium]
MKIFDVTVPITNSMAVWPGDPAVNNHLVAAIENGDEANVTAIHMSAHTGTHIDAPRHFVENGDGIESLHLSTLLGEVEVVEIDSNVDHIDVDTLAGLNKERWKTRVLFKTRNSRLRLIEKQSFDQAFTALLPEAANYLVNRGVKLVGIDYLSIAPFENGMDTHLAFLKNNVIVIEGLNLSDVSAGIYNLIALPILLENGDGAPARVLLIQS